MRSKKYLFDFKRASNGTLKLKPSETAFVPIFMAEIFVAVDATGHGRGHLTETRRVRTGVFGRFRGIGHGDFVEYIVLNESKVNPRIC